MIKNSIKTILVFAIAGLILSQAYLGLAMPVLNFMDNDLVDDTDTKDETSEKSTVIVHGVDKIFDDEDPNYNPIQKDPETTAEPIVFEPGTVSEATTTRASSITFNEGTKNVLLLGINSEEGCTDSIFILNIDETNHLMKLVSLPRDTYVPHSQATQEAMKETGFYYSAGSFKLNAVYYIGREIISYTGGKFNNSGIDYLCAVIGQLIPGTEIDDYMYVDFEGFMDVIDVIGGVYVDVPEDMYESQGQLILKEGYQKLNSEQALYYVRHRYRRDSSGTNLGTGGSNYRSENQANFLANIIGQVTTSENLSYGKVVDMLDTLKGSLYHSIEIGDIPEYINIGLDYMKKMYSVVPYVIVGREINPFSDGVSYAALD